MEPRARTVLTVLVVLLVIGVPMAVLFVEGGDDAKPASVPQPRATGLWVERGVAGSDLTVYVRPRMNVPAQAGGRRQVVLECVDSDGDRVIAQDEAWPFLDTDQGTLAPHAHVTLDSLGLSAVERCLVRGTKPLLQAPVP